MDKPFTIQVQEVEQSIVGIINKSQLPAYVLITMFQNLIEQIREIDNKDIQKYADSLKEKNEQDKESEE